MTQPVPNPPPGFDDLTTEEKVEYVSALWDRVLGTRSSRGALKGVNSTRWSCIVSATMASRKIGSKRLRLSRRGW